jgi:putative transposase
MIDPEHDLPIQKQAEVLQISRSSVYYQPRPVSEPDLWLMRRIDQLHLDYPFAGSRMLRDLLWQQGLVVGRRHVRTLMQKMAIEAIYRRPNTSKPAPGHRIYPYLLRGLAITQPNQVWAMDIRTSPWRAASSIWLRWSTGSAARFLPGSCRSPWKPASAS